MTLRLNQTLNSNIDNLINGQTTPSRLTPAIAVQLSQLGILKLDGRNLVVDVEKAKSRQARFLKRMVQLDCDSAVAKVLLEDLLTVPQGAVQHRQVWEAVGEKKFTRDQVLKSLRSLRDVGFLKSFRQSNNNFQVFWARKEDIAGPVTFTTNGCASKPWAWEVAAK